MKRRALLKLVLTLTLAFGALAPPANVFKASVRALLKLVLTLTLAFGALAPLANVFKVSVTAVADSATPITRNSDRAEEPVPMTDRIPWLIYVVLTSSTVALAWILFSLARARMRNASRDEEKQT